MKRNGNYLNRLVVKNAILQVTGSDGVYELLELTPQTANLLLNDSLNQAKLEHSYDTPLITFFYITPIQLVIEGVTSLEEVAPLS